MATPQFESTMTTLQPLDTHSPYLYYKKKKKISIFNCQLPIYLYLCHRFGVIRSKANAYEVLTFK